MELLDLQKLMEPLPGTISDLETRATEKQTRWAVERNGLYHALDSDQRRLGFHTAIFANELAFDSNHEEELSVLGLMIQTLELNPVLVTAPEVSGVDELIRRCCLEMGKTKLRIVMREVLRVVKGLTPTLREDCASRQDSPFATWLQEERTMKILAATNALDLVQGMYSNFHAQAHSLLHLQRQQDLEFSENALRNFEMTAFALLSRLKKLEYVPAIVTPIVDYAD